MSAHRVQLDGRLCRWENQQSKMDVFIDAALLHVGVDGAIGTSKSSTNDKVCIWYSKLLTVHSYKNII